MRTERLVTALVLVTACTGPPRSDRPAAPTVVSSTAPSTPAVHGDGGPTAVHASPTFPSLPVSAPAWPSAPAGPALPVSELLSDLLDTPQPPSTNNVAHSHGHGDDGAAIGSAASAEVATTWTITRSASRFDDPRDDRRLRLIPLAAGPAVAAAADRAAPRADPAQGGATWAIVTAVDDCGDGWWRITYTRKQTGDGQVGPTSTPATLDVHVNEALLVDAEQP